MRCQMKNISCHYVSLNGYLLCFDQRSFDIFELIQAIPPCHILLNSIQLGENLSVLFCFDFYYIELPQRLKLLQIYVFSIF